MLATCETSESLIVHFDDGIAESTSSGRLRELPSSSSWWHLDGLDSHVFLEDA
jgi:hypothetical protein